MNSIYLYKSGELKQKDYSIVLITKEEEILVPIEQVDTIFCFGTVTMNTRLVQLLNHHGIEIIFFNYYGKCIGRYLPICKKCGDIILKQTKSLENNQMRIHICKQIQKAAIQNCLNLVKYYHKKGKEVHKQSSAMENLLKEMEETTDVEHLFLLEAQAKKEYYSAFDEILKGTEFCFERRSKRPPENEINAMMSYGYSILYSAVLASIDRSRLLPELAYIHSTEKNGPALHFDLADIYKPVIIDRLIFRLVRRKQIKKDDFCISEEGCRMEKSGVKIFIEEYDLVMKSTAPAGKRKYSYKGIITHDVHSLSNYIEGKEPEFHPFVMGW